jgi:hypothetical protein
VSDTEREVVLAKPLNGLSSVKEGKRLRKRFPKECKKNDQCVLVRWKGKKGTVNNNKRRDEGMEVQR